MELTVEILDQKLNAFEQRLEQKLEQKLNAQNVELRAEMKEIRAELNAQNKELRTELNARNKEIRSDVNSIKAWMAAAVLVGVLVVTTLMNTYMSIAGS